MAKGATGHLDQERIIEAVLDESGLDETARRHLIECAICRGQKEALEGGLARFTQISRKCTPMPRRRPRLSGAELHQFKMRWKIRPSIAMGVAIASILAVLLSPFTFGHKQARVYNLQMVYTEMAQDEKFMTEIEGLEENPLPSFYVEISDPTENTDDMQKTPSSPGGAG
jgi:hypothetical protein